MSMTESVKIDFADPYVEASAHEAVEAAMREIGKSSMRETAGIDAAEFFDDKYWERRCHRAEEELQAIARELERVRGSLEEKLSVIACLEQNNRMLSAQLDMVYLIFGGKK